MTAAFAYTVEGKTVFGDKVVAWGTFTPSGGSTGGDIITTLKRVEYISLQHTGSGVVSDDPVADETFPLTGSTAVTIVTVADKPGLWWAFGNL